MPYRFGDLVIDRIGVVGSGNIGPDIALYFAKSFQAAGVPVVVVDVAPQALDKGRAKFEQKVGKGLESGAFTPEAAEAMLNGITFTTDYGQLEGASLVVEAATESLEIKRKIFGQLESICDPAAILASNSSHLEPERIFGELTHPGRTAVIHYFFPAERNPLVEIVAGKATDPALTRRLMRLYEAIGKVPIEVGSRYGYAVNPVFEGLFLAAALAVEEGLGTTREVDAVTRRALGLGVGPFTAMNLTGGNPITSHALDQMTRFAPWWRTPQLMKDAMASGRPWDVPRRDDTVAVTPERERQIGDLMRGAYFGLVGQILDSGITSLADLDLGIETGLVMKPPFEYMNELGPERALELVEGYAAGHPGFAVPKCLKDQVKKGGPFAVDLVLRRDHGDVAVLTIRRPSVLNALNDEVYTQLGRRFVEIRDDRRITALVLTGFGPKAFVSGADVTFLSRIASPAEGVATSERSKVPGTLLEQMDKPSVCALNGMALGGGNEIAMCCTARIIRKGIGMAVGQPEPNLGIVPGAGATQRLPRLVGLEKAALMLRTGRPLSGKEAVACGLIREEVEGDVVEAAVELARAAVQGQVALRPIDRRALATPDALPPVELGHLSRAIDGLICRAILEGCRKPLYEGLRVESEMFGACCATEDMRIGVANFVKNGPRAKAEFVNH